MHESSGGATALPSLALPSREARDDEVRAAYPVLERKGMAPRGATHSLSARGPRDKAEQFRRDEDTIRAVYKKHATTFFEEIKDGFTKEVAGLRKQVQKGLAKMSANWELDGQDSPVPLAQGLQAQIAALQRQVQGIQQVQERAAHAASVVAQGGRSQSDAASPAATASPLDAREAARLAETVAKVQEEVRALSRHARSETAAAKKAALIPVWKERALQEIAQGELRAVCAAEVEKALRDFSSTFDELQMAPALQRICEEDGAPREGRLRAELHQLCEELSRQVEEHASRLDHNTQAKAAIVERMSLLEADVRQASAAAESAANGPPSGTTAKRLQSLQESVGSLEARAKDFDALEQRCGALHGTLAGEAAERRAGGERATASITALGARLDGEQAARAALAKQIADLGTHRQESMRGLNDVQQQSFEQARAQRDALRAVEASAAAAAAAANDATEQCSEARRLAESLVTKAQDARFDAEASRSMAERALAEASSALGAAAKSADVAARGEAAVVRHTSRLGALEDRVGGLHRHLEAHGTAGAPSAVQPPPVPLPQRVAPPAVGAAPGGRPVGLASAMLAKPAAAPRVSPVHLESLHIRSEQESVVDHEDSSALLTERLCDDAVANIGSMAAYSDGCASPISVVPMTPASTVSGWNGP